MSKICKATALLLLIATLAGCTNTQDTIHERIHKKYYDMPSYTATCSVTVSSNKTRNTYDVSVWYDRESDRYRIDYDNMSIILGDANAQIKKGDTVMSAPTDDSYMIMLPNAFFKSYYEGENAWISASVANAGQTVLECEIVNPPKFASSMKLWIDNKTLLPRTMKVYDKDDNEKINVEYNEFKILEITDDSIFEF